MNEIKPLLKSWTIWFGILQIASGIVGFFSHQLDAQAAQAMILTGMGTVALRFKTKQPII